MKRRKVGSLLAGLMLVSAMALPVSAANNGSTEVYTEVPEEWTLTIPMDAEIPYNKTVKNFEGYLSVAGNINQDTTIDVYAVRSQLYNENIEKASDVNDRNKIDYTLDARMVWGSNEQIKDSGYETEIRDFISANNNNTGFQKRDVSVIPDEKLFSSSMDPFEEGNIEPTKLGSYNSLICYLNSVQEGNKPMIGSFLTALVNEEEWDKVQSGRYHSVILFQATARSDSSEDEGGNGNLPH